MILWTAVCLSAAACFWFFRQATHFLGDGYLVLRTLAVAAETGDIPASFPTAPLTGLLAVNVLRLLHHAGAGDPALLAWQLLSIGSGILAIPMFWYLAGHLWTDTRERMLGTALLLFSGSLMLFFAYVETYPLAFAVCIAYVGAALGVQRGRASLWLASTLFSLLVFLHVGMSIFTPSLLYLFVKHLRAQGWSPVLRSSLSILVVSAAALTVVGYAPNGLVATFTRDGTSFLPLHFTDAWGSAYALFSLWHFVDLMNVFLLILPFSLVLVGGFAASAFLPARFRHADAAFWMFLAGPALLWLFFNNFELGLSRDWDLAAAFVFVIALAGVVSWSELMGPGQARMRGLLIMVILTGVQTVGWVAVNASTERSLRRFEAVLDFRFQSERAVAIALEEVGGYRRSQNDFEGAADAYAQCVVLDSMNARRWTLLANAATMSGNPIAQSSYERAIALGSEDPEVYLNLGILRFLSGEVREGIRLAQDAAERDSLNATIAYTLGRMYEDGVRDTLSALPWFLRAVELDSTLVDAHKRATECSWGSASSKELPRGAGR
jgi:tetratricopeptide (TPR) repeat protein